MSLHHIVVGDGLTAAEFASTCQLERGDKLTVIGPDINNLGRGAAYACAAEDAPWRYAYLLNSPSRSVDPDFAIWMQANWAYFVERLSGRRPDWLAAAEQYIKANELTSLNAPREIYGDFARSRTRLALDGLRTKGVDVHLINGTVEQIEPQATGFKLSTEDGRAHFANTIDVATGGPQNQRFSGDDNENSFPALFGNEKRIAEKLRTGGKLLCIGAAAAMLDCLRFYQSIQPESQLNLTAISPAGNLLKALRPSDKFTPTPFDLSGTFKTAKDFLISIKAAQQQALAAGDTLYETRVGMRNLFLKTSLTEFIPDISEARKVAQPLFAHFQGGTRDSIDDFSRLMKTGNTQIVAGRVLHIEQENDFATIHYKDKTNRTIRLSANVIVNCAGPGNTNRFDKLTNTLLREDWISLCPQSGGVRVGKGGHTSVAGVRYLGPAVTSIGNSVEPVPLYDASRLRRAVQQFNSVTNPSQKA